MPSKKRYKSITHSIAHHAVSGLSFVHPHLGKACEEVNAKDVAIDLLAEEPCPNEFIHLKPLRLSLTTLKNTFIELLEKEGFSVQDVKEAVLTFSFYPHLDHYCSRCFAHLVSTDGDVFEQTVNFTGKTEQRA